MSHKIPKLQWRNITLSGTSTIDTDVLSGLASTLDLRVGMIVGAPFTYPEGTVIEEILDSTSVRVSANAYSTVTVNRELYYEHVFKYPPIEDPEEIAQKERVSNSISGARQVSVDFQEFKRKLSFSFLTEEELANLRFFWNDWAHTGAVFKYFDDKTSMYDFKTYEKDQSSFEPSKATPVLFKIEFKWRRLV